MLKPGLREICRMPDGSGGGGPEGGGGPGAGPNDTSGYGSDPGSGNTGSGKSGGAAAGPTGGGPTGFDTSGRGGFDAAGFDTPGGYAGMPGGPPGAEYANMDSMATGENLESPPGGIGWGSVVGGILGTVAFGPIGGIVGSTIGSYAIDGKGIGESLGGGLGGGIAGGLGSGLAGIAAGMAGSKAGGWAGSQLDAVTGTSPGVSTSTAGLSIDPTSSALDIGGPPGGDPTGGGVNFTYSPPIAGQTFDSYLPTPAQAPVQPSWRGLLSTPPQPNYWQGNSLFVPTRGLLS